MRRLPQHINHPHTTLQLQDLLFERKARVSVLLDFFASFFYQEKNEGLAVSDISGLVDFFASQHRHLCVKTKMKTLAVAKLQSCLIFLPPKNQTLFIKKKMRA